ncbi:MAG: helix-turn-helix domain-containing protein [Armatimonadota bacterium]
MPDADDNNLLNVTQAHRQKGVSRSAIYQAIESGRLASTVIGGHVFVSTTDLDRWRPLTPTMRKGLSIGGRKKQAEETPHDQVG